MTKEIEALRLCLQEIEQFHSLAYPECTGGCPAHEAMKAAREALNLPEDLWQEDPEHPREDWRLEVRDDNTLLGYWNWVAAQREQAEDEES